VVSPRKRPPVDRRRVAQALWSAVPAAAATEVGAVAVIVLGVVPGLLVALAALVVLVLTLPRIHPPEGVVRGVLFATGPPLRYALVGAMTWHAWTVRGEGPFLSILAGLALVLVMPVAALGLGALIHRGTEQGKA
jgi:hypothetical protein